MPRFTGKVAIVTGSSSGIGRAVATLFAKEGAKVTIHGRNATNLKETHRHLLAVGARDENILEVLGDVTLEENRHALVDNTIKRFGRLDILINNAADLAPGSMQKTLEQLTNEDYDFTMNTNLKAVVALTKLAIPHLVKSKGEIVSVTTPGEHHAAPAFFYSAMAKVALNNFTRSLAVTHGPLGVRANAVGPGIVDTPAFEKVGLPPQAVKAFEAQVAKKLPLRRLCEASEIASTIAFLCDRSQSGCILGQVIVADGGSTLLTHAMAHD